MKAFLLLLTVGLGVWGNYEHTERVRAQRAIAGAESTRQQAIDARAYIQRQLDEAKRMAGVQETNLRYEHESLAMELESAKRKIALLTSQLATAESRETAPSPAPVVQYRAVPAPVDPLARFFPKTDPTAEQLQQIELQLRQQTYQLRQQRNEQRLSRFNGR